MIIEINLRNIYRCYEEGIAINCPMVLIDSKKGMKGYFCQALNRFVGWKRKKDPDFYIARPIECINKYGK